MERPEITQEIIQEAAKQAAKNVGEWAIYSHLDTEALERDIAQEYSHGDNGYELAKKLDRRGYCPASEMVESLDCMDNAVDDLYRKLCWQWVKENNIEPPLQIGNEIRVSSGNLNGKGIITGVSTYTPAAYEVDIGKGPNYKLIVLFEHAELYI